MYAPARHRIARPGQRTLANALARMTHGVPGSTKRNFERVPRKFEVTKSRPFGVDRLPWAIRSRQAQSERASAP
eukprot:3489136-Pyramimonas_sp.AAC.1